MSEAMSNIFPDILQQTVAELKAVMPRGTTKLCITICGGNKLFPKSVKYFARTSAQETVRADKLKVARNISIAFVKSDNQR